LLSRPYLFLVGPPRLTHRCENGVGAIADFWTAREEVVFV